MKPMKPISYTSEIVGIDPKKEDQLAPLGMRNIDLTKSMIEILGVW